MKPYDIKNVILCCICGSDTSLVKLNSNKILCSECFDDLCDTCGEVGSSCECSECSCCGEIIPANDICDCLGHDPEMGEIDKIKDGGIL